MTTQPSADGNQAAPSVQAASEALLKLGDLRPELAMSLSRLIVAISDEAARTSRFATALSRALPPASRDDVKTKRTGRRAAGAIDPFSTYKEIGADGLRDRLGQLDLEQLRDIVAEHGMDHDRLAMKWKRSDRVVDRIVDKVVSRTAKGSAFRDEQ